MRQKNGQNSNSIEMSELRRHIMMQNGAYESLPFIESTPDICIRTDIEIDFSMTDYEFGGEGFYYEARDTDYFIVVIKAGLVSPRWMFARNSEPITPNFQSRMYYAASSAPISSINHPNVPITYTDFSFDMIAGRLHVETNAGSYYELASVVTANEKAFVIYAMRSYLRVKSTYIKKGGVLISQTIPVMRKSDSVYGLYDLVRNKFYPFEPY